MSFYHISSQSPRYFWKMLAIFSSLPFYMTYVHLPTAHDLVPPQIYNNPKFWLFFKDAIGAIDGSHIHSAPLVLEWLLFQYQKGFCSQNFLFCCNFALHFVYTVTGWEESATGVLSKCTLSSGWIGLCKYQVCLSFFFKVLLC